ncbi:unnamed protein product [Gongylonema pulchrum]|uniref:Ovule protein n=1 Tax=Gongylonema pulchrum TaxID=637853 RepID=A0A183DZE7_9BILA|nr:unnamed protein product [Gongylonema pulchrum]
MAFSGVICEPTTTESNEYDSLSEKSLDLSEEYADELEIGPADAFVVEEVVDKCFVCFGPLFFNSFRISFITVKKVE